MVFNVAIIGAGVIGHRLAGSFSRCKDTKVTWICDIDIEKATELAEEMQIKATNDFQLILLDNSVDIIYVGVPPRFHKEITIQALTAGKHVICEKPISLSAAEGEEMIDALKKSGKKACINLPFRYTPAVQTLQDILNKNELGDLEQLQLRFRFPQWPRAWQNVDWLKTKEQGGALREVGTHYYFLLAELRDYIGSIQKVQANVEYHENEACEYSATGIITLDSGLQVRLDLHTDGDYPEENTLIIKGNLASISFEQWYQLYRLNNNKEMIDDRRESAEYKMICAFIRELQGKSVETPTVTFADALHAQKILEAIHNSHEKWIVIK